MILQPLDFGPPIRQRVKVEGGVAGGFQIAPNTMQVRVRARVETGVLKVKMRKSPKLAGPNINPIKLHRYR